MRVLMLSSEVLQQKNRIYAVAYSFDQVMVLLDTKIMGEREGET